LAPSETISDVVDPFTPQELTMPRSLLLSLVAAITLAACSKQEADTGAAPAPDTAAPEANAPVDTTAVDRMPADTTATVPADTAPVEETVPADTAPAAETMDSTMNAPTDTAAPADSSAGY
jgi:hypothetical protein